MNEVKWVFVYASWARLGQKIQRQKLESETQSLAKKVASTEFNYCSLFMINDNLQSLMCLYLDKTRGLYWTDEKKIESELEMNITYYKPPTIIQQLLDFKCRFHHNPVIIVVIFLLE